MKAINSALTALFVVLQITVYSQTDSVKTKKPQYLNMILSGGLIGTSRNGTSFSVSTIHGIRSRTGHTLGVGVSYDDYTTAGWRVMPIFASFSVNVASITNSHINLQADVGSSVMWPLNRDEFWGSNISKGGGMFHPSIVYRHALTEIDLYFRLGFKFQYIIYEQRWGDFLNVTRIEREMNRISAHIGFGFH